MISCDAFCYNINSKIIFFFKMPHAEDGSSLMGGILKDVIM